MDLWRCAVRVFAAATIFSSVAHAAPSGPPLDYAAAANWVCRPDKLDACHSDLTTAILRPDGSVVREHFERSKRPDVDCFYIYPTVSELQTLTATPGVTEAERRAVRQQVERLASVCKLFVPFYRQGTTAAMKPGAARRTREEVEAAGKLAEADTLAAWDEYVRRFNRGRGVVLIGHSQGAAMIKTIIRRRIEGQPMRRQLVSAIIPGSFYAVRSDRSAGGTFQSLEPCRDADQFGCVIAFNAYRAEQPLPADRVMSFPGEEAICTNPAALDGRRAELKPYLSAKGETIIPMLTAQQPPWTDPTTTIREPFVALPGLLWAECKSDQHGVYLAVTVSRSPGDVRTGAFVGDWLVEGMREPTMGLHLIDLNLVAGNLQEVLQRQASAYLAARQRTANVR